MIKNRTIIYSLFSLLLLGAVFFVGVYVGYEKKPAIDKVTSIDNKENPTGNNADFDSFWKTWKLLNDKSIYASNVSDEERVWGAIAGMTNSLGDPYTVFFSPEENKLFTEEIKGSFGGIGAEVGMKDKYITIIAPLKNSPSEASGLKAGDKVLKIDDKETTNLTVDSAISLIRGEKGTVVTLTILREGERATREIKITRDEIQIPTIDTKLRDEGVFVISFYSFSQSSDKLFLKALEEFKASKSDKLIIDLRGNPGGYLDVAVNIGSWFIDEGKVIVSEDFGNKKKPHFYRSRGPKLFEDKLKLVVLIDGGSASASEILAGALREYDLATLVGQNTFGKGSVQELLSITEDTSLKVTVAKWLTPKGVSISENGLKPDVEVDYTQKDFDAKKDPQMDKAVEILLKK